MTEDKPPIALTTAQSRLLKGTLVANIVLYAGLAVLLVHPFGFIFFHCVRYLWLYIGALAALLAFGLAWLAGRRLFGKFRQRLRFSGQSAGILFALVGIVLIGSVFFTRGCDLDTAGYWLHVRIWLDAEKVRDWAQNLDMRSNGTSRVYRPRWPLTLWMAAPLSGRVCVDADTRDVMLEHGSALTGHWGVFITDKDRSWPAEHDLDEEMRCWKLANGAWVWRTPD